LPINLQINKPTISRATALLKCGLRRTRTIFRQINKDKAAVHHDALEFPDGQVVLLTALNEGQQATVLQLPAEPKTNVEAAANKRVAYVG